MLNECIRLALTPKIIKISRVGHKYKHKSAYHLWSSLMLYKFGSNNHKIWSKSNSNSTSLLDSARGTRSKEAVTSISPGNSSNKKLFSFHLLNKILSLLYNYITKHMFHIFLSTAIFNVFQKVDTIIGPHYIIITIIYLHSYSQQEQEGGDSP